MNMHKMEVPKNQIDMFDQTEKIEVIKQPEQIEQTTQIDAEGRTLEMMKKLA